MNNKTIIDKNPLTNICFDKILKHSLGNCKVWKVETDIM